LAKESLWTSSGHELVYLLAVRLPRVVGGVLLGLVVVAGLVLAASRSLPIGLRLLALVLVLLVALFVLAIVTDPG
jgi:hypothetical protein